MRSYIYLSNYHQSKDVKQIDLINCNNNGNIQYNASITLNMKYEEKRHAMEL